MQINQLLAQMGGGGGFGMNRQQDADAPKPDTAEQIQISSLSLLKMLKHARAGVPMEVMGLMLGQLIDDYTIRVIDVFAMPQSGTGVSVEAVDPVFQQQMTELLKQTGRSQLVVGWYHSHPGFGCWLSGVDCSTQQSFERLQSRAVAVVVDPIQSVKGKVVIDAFRLIQSMMMGMGGVETRQTTSNIGHLKKPTITAMVHGLNKMYYGMPIAFRQNDFEQKMLLNLHKANWSWGLQLGNFQERQKKNESTLKELTDLTDKYQKWISDQTNKTKEQFIVSTVGKLNPKTHLEDMIQGTLTQNVSQCLGTMINTVVF